VSDVVLGEGKGELGILVSARLVQFYRHILEDYDQMQFGYEVVKLIAKASEMVDEPEWYDMLADLLMALDNKTIPLPLAQTWFYVHYGNLLGHDLNLARDTDGEKLSADKTYRYDSGDGGLRESGNGRVGAEHIKLLRLIATKSLKVLAQVGGTEGVLADCLHVAREHAGV